MRPSPLSGRFILVLAAAALAWPAAVWAQAPASAPAAAAAPAASAAPAVQVSTDPERAAAVLKAAAALKQRPRPAAVGLVRGETAAGHRLLSGGITAEDRSAMQAEGAGYSLWVSTVARPSGAYLAEVELQIERIGPQAAGRKAAASKTLVLQRQLEGPWLFVALPAGSYAVSGRFRDHEGQAPQTLNQRVNIGKKGQRQVVLRFASAADVDAEAAAASAPGAR